ncbi:glycosyltransferase [Phycicoccus sp. Root563]|uniref:glycosyltransferase n=1 Tax=Phycicoccus sp. Root563 TaxID=1736562 RepID=UPI00138F0E3F|nr:glycosyltransferase [Phycicoccus sp. Root563]
MTIGTDHQPFDRLIGWVDDFLAVRQDMADQVLVQHGQTAPASRAKNRAFFPFDELNALMASSDVVITHGGPGTIFEARAQGRLPLCVPRDPDLGEIVDGHQQRFARRLAADSLVLLAEDQQTFERLLTAALAQPEIVRIPQDDSRVRVTADRLDAYVTNVVMTGRSRWWRG